MRSLWAPFDLFVYRVYCTLHTVAVGSLCDCCGVRDKEQIGLPEYGSGGNSQYGFALAKNDRARMEDAVAMEENVAGHKCLAVFDGHGGDKAARRAQELLPKQLSSLIFISSSRARRRRL